MLETPFSFEFGLAPVEFERIGRLSLRWSHIDHIIGNCLRAKLRLTNSEAVIAIFSLPAERRLSNLNDLAKMAPLNSDAFAALTALNWVMPGLRSIRNNVIHAVLNQDDDGEIQFELRSKQRSYSKAQIFASEELTNFAAHAAISLRMAIGVFGADGERHPLPPRPQVPESLRPFFN